MGKGAYSVKEVPPEFNFWLCDGRVIRSLFELSDAFKSIPSEVFAYHANSQKNDFADWIRDIVKDQQLAYLVRKSQSLKGTQEVLEKRLRGLRPIQVRPKLSAPVPVALLPEHKVLQIQAPETKTPFEKKLNLIAEREKSLIAKEKQLFDEEQKVNDAKIELIRRRYELLKERGILDKDKFEIFMQQRPGYKQAEDKKTEVTIDKTKLEQLIEQAKVQAQSGNLGEAANQVKEIYNLLKASKLTSDEKKVLGYRIMDLEADVKLASLKRVV